MEQTLRKLIKHTPIIGPYIQRRFATEYLSKDKICSEAHNDIIVTHEGIPVPPIRLRDMVRRDAHLVEDFIIEGRQVYELVKFALDDVGYHFSNDSRLLEFGMGCGRVARHFLLAGAQKFVGTDVDIELIDWATRNLAVSPRVQFYKNNYKPPLPISASSVDICYSISVFTHMDVENQKIWAAEIGRVVCPNGIFMVSFHERSKEVLPGGVKCRERVDPEHQRSWFGADGAPNVYYGTYNTADYFSSLFSSDFELIKHYKNCIREIQSVMVFRRK